MMMSAGCRYHGMNAVGRNGPAPWANLSCFDPVAEEGFSFEIPDCDCEAGIRLRYVVSHIDQETVLRLFIRESGYLDDDTRNDVLMISSSPYWIDELYIGGRKIYGPEDEVWAISTESFKSIWENYSPLLTDMHEVCTEDRLMKKVKANTTYIHD
jgi:hypothetical protein